MRILLIGSHGQLGCDLFRLFEERGEEVLGVPHATLDVCDEGPVEEFIASARPDVVVNTAAYHNVEECTRQPRRAFEVNAVGPLNLASSCQRHGAVLVHFSTDYVFDGQKRSAYEEADLPNPLNVYGASKVAGEHLVASHLDRYFLVRTCGLYGHVGSRGKGGNFVETMLRKGGEGATVRVVNDQVLTPTATESLARAVWSLMYTKAFGLYHATDAGECSWHEFARTIFEVEKMTVDLIPVSTEEFPTSVRRPLYSVLCTNRLNALGISMPSWEASLERYLRTRRDKTRRASIAQ